jgi:prepilin-type N-terminal cleavage/methylation domain-containing protein
VKTTLQARLLSQCVCKSHQGFTLLELTIVLVIGGILAAIAIPSFLNQANNAKQVEAKMYLGSLNRAQQEYILQHSQFTNDMQQLGVVPYNSPNYRYSIDLDANNNLYAVHVAESLSPTLRPYVGMTAIQKPAGEAMVNTVLCESGQAMLGKAPVPLYDSVSLDCAVGSRNLN